MSIMFCPSSGFEQGCCTSGIDGGVNKAYGARPLVIVFVFKDLEKSAFFLYFSIL